MDILPEILVSLALILLGETGEKRVDHRGDVFDLTGLSCSFGQNTQVEADTEDEGIKRVINISTWVPSCIPVA